MSPSFPTIRRHPTAPAQPTFPDLEASSGRVTRRRRFLALLDSKIPWGAWAARVEPHYPKAGGGHPPVPLGTMLRMYVVQVAFQLSDEGTEDALWDSAAVRSFVGCGDAVPDATAPCCPRSLLSSNGLGRALLDEPDASLEAEGLRMSAGTIAGAAFAGAPPGTKSARKRRDPEARQAKRGRDRHHGLKAHAGAGAAAGTVHAPGVTAANAHGLARAASPVGPGDTDVWADSGVRRGLQVGRGHPRGLGAPARRPPQGVRPRGGARPRGCPRRRPLPRRARLPRPQGPRGPARDQVQGPGDGDEPALRRVRRRELPARLAPPAPAGAAGLRAGPRAPALRACGGAQGGGRCRVGGAGAPPRPPDAGGTQQKSPGGPSRAGF